MVEELDKYFEFDRAITLLKYVKWPRGMRLFN